MRIGLHPFNYICRSRSLLKIMKLDMVVHRHSIGRFFVLRFFYGMSSEWFVTKLEFLGVPYFFAYMTELSCF